MLRALILPALIAQTAPTPLPPGKLIPASEGKQMIQAYRQADAATRAAAFTLKADGSLVQGIAFSAESIRSLLDKAGIVTVVWHFALHPDNTITLVGVGYDANGVETPEYINAGAICPPYCYPTTPQ